MAYRCGSCGYFASIDDPECSVENEEYDGNSFSCEVTASYPSGCCGDEVAVAYYNPIADVELEHVEGCEAASYDIKVDEPQPTDRFQDKDRHGKPIKSMRYQRHYYGVEVTATIKCESCGAEETVTTSDESGPPEEV